jgi:hypothetical protein
MRRQPPHPGRRPFASDLAAIQCQPWQLATLKHIAVKVRENIYHREVCALRSSPSFPDFFAGFFENGIVRRALAEELVTVGVHDLRAFTHDRHRTVDDRPFGGGEGMVLKAEPLAEALASLGIGRKVEQS